jgi:hypothetical protein
MENLQPVFRRDTVVYSPLVRHYYLTGVIKEYSQYPLSKEEDKNEV